MGGGTLSRRLWLTMALFVAVAAVVVGWQSGMIRQWASNGRMALFRLSLTRELSRGGARWTVRSSANLRGALWIVHLDRDGVDSAAVYLLFFPSSAAARDQFAKSGNAFVPPVLTGWVKGTPPPPVHSDPPIISHRSLRGVGQANVVGPRQQRGGHQVPTRPSGWAGLCGQRLRRGGRGTGRGGADCPLDA